MNLKSLLKTSVLMLILLISATYAGAQVQGTTQKSLPPDSYKERPKSLNTPEKKANETMDKLTKTLNLKDDQIAPLKKAMLSFETEKEKVEKSTLANNQKYAKVQTIQQKKHKDLQKLLTKDQYKTYQLTFP